MQILAFADGGFSVMLALTILVIIYAITLLNRQLRLLQYQVSTLEEDIKLLSEELKMVSNRNPDPNLPSSK
jgi:hypothetical protein